MGQQMKPNNKDHLLTICHGRAFVRVFFVRMLGSSEGGRTAAISTSFMATCREHNFHPRVYLQDVLTRLAQGATDLDALLPATGTRPALIWTGTYILGTKYRLTGGLLCALIA